MVSTTDARDDSDWQRAWDAIGQLAAARSHLESQLAVRVDTAGGGTVLFPAFGSPATRQEQLDKDLAEIAAVSRELRRVEPTLAPGHAPQAVARNRSVVDIWALMGIIWAAACLMGAAAAVAVLHLA